MVATKTQDPVVRAETKRFKAWLAERRISTAPVDTWPPDELDFFGNGNRKPKTGRVPRRKGAK